MSKKSTIFDNTKIIRIIGDKTSYYWHKIGMWAGW